MTREEIAYFIDHTMTEQERKKTLMFKPAKRIALDGKVWWMVWDTDQSKYSTLLCFGKYKTKKDCQFAIDWYTTH